MLISHRGGVRRDLDPLQRLIRNHKVTGGSVSIRSLGKRSETQRGISGDGSVVGKFAAILAHLNSQGIGGICNKLAIGQGRTPSAFDLKTFIRCEIYGRRGVTLKGSSDGTADSHVGGGNGDGVRVVGGGVISGFCIGTPNDFEGGSIPAHCAVGNRELDNSTGSHHIRLHCEMIDNVKAFVRDSLLSGSNNLERGISCQVGVFRIDGCIGHSHAGNNPAKVLRGEADPLNLYFVILTLVVAVRSVRLNQIRIIFHPKRKCINSIVHCCRNMNGHIHFIAVISIKITDAQRYNRSIVPCCIGRHCRKTENHCNHKQDCKSPLKGHLNLPPNCFILDCYIKLIVSSQ